MRLKLTIEHCNELSQQIMNGHDSTLIVSHLSGQVRVDDISRGTFQTWDFPGMMLNEQDCCSIKAYFDHQRTLSPIRDMTWITPKNA